MDIVVENLKKIEDVLEKREDAVRWGLLSLCRIEYEFYAFAKRDHQTPSLNLTKIVDKCIDFVCNGTNHSFADDSEEIQEFAEEVNEAYENGHETNLAIYCMRQLENLTYYLDFLNEEGKENIETIADFILSTIAEDYLAIEFDLDLSDFAKSPIVLDEVNRIWDDFEFIKDCTNKTLWERAQRYRSLDVMNIE